MKIRLRIRIGLRLEARGATSLSRLERVRLCRRAATPHPVPGGVGDDGDDDDDQDKATTKLLLIL